MSLDIDALRLTPARDANDAADADASTSEVTSSSSSSILPNDLTHAVRFTTEREAEACASRARAMEKAHAQSFARMSTTIDALRRDLENWSEDTRLRVRALSSNHHYFQDAVEKLRATLERELAEARSTRVGGAEAAKRAVQKCLRGAETLRTESLPTLRELSEASTSERAQLSRKILSAWQTIEAEFHERYDAAVDFDAEIARGATLVDPMALLTLVEDASTCAGARTPALCEAIDAFAMECLVPKRLALLPKARANARASDVGKPMPTLVAAPPRQTPSPSSASMDVPASPPSANDDSKTAAASQREVFATPPTSAPPTPSFVSRARLREDVSRELQAFLTGAFAARVDAVDAHDLNALVDEFLALSPHHYHD